MPIRSVPFEQINADLIESLKRLRVREDRTLDYKRDLNLESGNDQSEFLKDVTAFANGSGGTLLYGVAEGRGEEEGRIADLPGVELPLPDKIHQTIDNILRDNVDGRIMGVLHRAIQRDDGKYYYVVRVPPSPLAPHMVTVGKYNYRFFLRANTTVVTMDALQIRETALRMASAMDEVQAIIDARRTTLIEQARRSPEGGGNLDHPADDVSQLILHVVPLFPAPGGFAIADRDVADRLARVPVLGYSSDSFARRYSLDGLYLSYDQRARAGFLRSGATEFREIPLPSIQTSLPGRRTLQGWQSAQDVLTTLDGCAALTQDGLLPLPLVVSLTLTGIRGSRLLHSPRSNGIAPDEIDLDVAQLTPFLLHAWDRTSAMQVRGMFDELCQAWGAPRDPNYGADGHRVWWSSSGRIEAPTPRYWADGW